MFANQQLKFSLRYTPAGEFPVQSKLAYGVHDQGNYELDACWVAVDSCIVNLSVKQFRQSAEECDLLWLP